ncbi:hypothetical protein AC578_5322 [Pseudocercospora eumusae]|uniref:Major facilitator superfamily (MFS) profile domain-containing protein n=1 Tax=Pseudocercospora eumusae TaxID=321146 RepID=A0A139GV62_9PEZI|nr:hypothetical protein AC578_5322 [Pseudocercospora eumusae]
MAIEKLHSLFDPNLPQHRGDDKEAAHELTDAGRASSNDRPAQDAQPGVQKIEAVTLTWPKKSVFLLLILIWFLTLVNNMKTSMVYSLSAYATSSFMGHSLLTVISVVASAMAGAVYIPMAKALDLWGRAEGFLVMTLFCIVGLVLLAASRSIETYCAGEKKKDEEDGDDDGDDDEAPGRRKRVEGNV